MTANPYIYRHAVLFVDDEEKSQKYFQKLFGNLFKIYVASDGEKGFEVFLKHQDEIGMIVTDQRMPNLVGSAMLMRISEVKSDAVKILSTAYSDIEAAIEAVNEGGIYRYVTKPWDIPELEITLRRAMEYYELGAQMKGLSRVKITGLAQMQLRSKIFASSAVPALMGHGASSVAALSDLISLALTSEVQAVAEDSGFEMSDFGVTDATGLEEFSHQLADLLPHISAAAEVDEGELVETINACLGRDGELVKAFFAFIAKKASDSDKERIARLFALYGMGWKLDDKNANGSLLKRGSDDKLGTVAQEICKLFLEEEMTVTSMIEDLSS